MSNEVIVDGIGDKHMLRVYQTQRNLRRAEARCDALPCWRVLAQVKANRGCNEAYSEMLRAMMDAAFDV